MPSQTMVWAQTMLGATLKEQYRLNGLLGEGAMGVVFRGVHLAMDKAVAIKMMRKETFDTPDAVERFNREARVWSQLNHPVITQVFDFGVHEGQPFLVMELVEGADLSEVLKREEKFEPLRAVKLMRQLAAALEEAHRLGVVHRDIKPQNMKLLRYTTGGKMLLKVLDFGMAKQPSKADQRLTAPGILVGTPKYAAPEQITENPLIDGRTDLYAAGVVFYELLTGNAPFLGNPHEVLFAQLGAEPRPLPDSVPPVIRDVVMRLLRKRPDDRFPSASALEQALEDCELGLRASSRSLPNFTSGMYSPVPISGPGVVPLSPSQVSGQQGPPSSKSQRGAAPSALASSANSGPIASPPPGPPSLRGNPSTTSAPSSRSQSRSQPSVEVRRSSFGRVILLTLFVTVAVGSGMVYYGLRHDLHMQRTVAGWIPSFHVPQDDEVEQTLRALEGARDGRNWAAMARSISDLEQRYGSTLLSEQSVALAALRQKVQLEQSMQDIFDRLVVAATKPDAEEVVQLHSQIVTESVYHRLAQPYFDSAIESYVVAHLAKAEELRLASRCAEFLTEVQKMLDAVPGHPQASAASRKECPPPVTAEPAPAAPETAPAP